MSARKYPTFPSYIRVAQGRRKHITHPFFLSGNVYPVNDGVNTYNVDHELASFMENVLEISTGCFSRKVFVGGLPPDIDEDRIVKYFQFFGPLRVDWPHKFESNSGVPPKGYAFLLFQNEVSVHRLVETCMVEGEKLFTLVSSSTLHNKRVQIRPWRLEDTDFMVSREYELNPRQTLFIGGVPRPCKAIEIAKIMERSFGGVRYVGIDTDPEFKYPKGSARVTFDNRETFIKAISSRFVHLQIGEINKTVEVKPYVLDDQMCDMCLGLQCDWKNAPFFCANTTCLKYYCEFCWSFAHVQNDKRFHKPLVKESSDKSKMFPILK